MTLTLFGITSMSFAVVLAATLWRLFAEVKANNKLRLELSGVIEHARTVESRHKWQKDRNEGYQSIIRHLKKTLDKKNALLKQHNIGAAVVIDDVLSNENGKT